MVENLKQYKGKKVFLTGHTGFKGSWMLSWLHLLGANVKGFALEPASNDLYKAIGGDALCSSVIANILDAERLHQEVLDFEPDFIFHLAAQPLVRLSYQIPAETFAVNAMGTLNVLEAVRKLKNACAVVMITTDKVYENHESHYAYRENDPLGGYDPYSASKACAEIIINSYRSAYFNSHDDHLHKKSIASARSGNVIGGGDWATDRIVPDIIRALKNRQPVIVRNPQAIRPWQHVLEPISGYLLLGAAMADYPLQFSKAYNFGPMPDDECTVEHLVDQALKTWGSGEYQNHTINGQPHEAFLLKLDINKAMDELHWKPKWNSAVAIKKTMDWYRKFDTAPNNALQLINETISDYKN